jgi:hypothetical protein
MYRSRLLVLVSGLALFASGCAGSLLSPLAWFGLSCITGVKLESFSDLLGMGLLKLGGN